MPKAFENAGYVIGVIGTITIGLLSTYCIRVLIKSEYELCKRRKIPSMTYPRTMEVSLEEGPQCLKRFAKYCP
jgi:proton-coupled amino acid transporter